MVVFVHVGEKHVQVFHRTLKEERKEEKIVAK